MTAGYASSAPLRICAVLTCFNRREKTLACLHALAVNALPGVELSAVLVDDASTDGTPAAVAARFPWVRIVSGDGSLFWCRGMHRAIAEAMASGYDHYLWLNDDTMLDRDALARLLACHAEVRAAAGVPVMLVGTTVDALTGQVSYGGESRASMLRAMRFHRILPTDRPQRCESMTGNIVLVPAETAARVGNIEPTFEHAMGDADYAMRAGRLGVQVWVPPGTFGTCSDNPPTGTFNDPALPLARRWKQMMSRKGLPWRSWLTFTSRHGGPLWPLHFAWPYMRVLTSGLRRRPAAARPVDPA